MKCKKCYFEAPVIDMSGIPDMPEFINVSPSKKDPSHCLEPILKCPKCGEIF
jgi:hypothetical protein